MNFKKPKFWTQKNIISFFFFPLSIFTYLINFFKKLYTKKKFKIKTICVGNIYIGGTGKTSLAIEINNILKNKFKTVFIKKKYSNQKDEINLLENTGKVIATSNRLKSLEIAEKKKFEIAIFDDGLQQKNIDYNIKIVCFNTNDGIGNGLLLPAGPLRESLKEIKNYNLAFLNGERENIKLFNKLKTINKDIKIFITNYFPINLKNFNRNKNYLMFCGIGNPQEFEYTMLKYKFKIKRKIIYPDHYKISNREISNMKKIAKKEKLTIITTEKDFFRLNKKQQKGIKNLKIKLKIKNLIKLKKILFNVNEKI